MPAACATEICIAAWDACAGGDVPFADVPFVAAGTGAGGIIPVPAAGADPLLGMAPISLSVTVSSQDIGR
jgi:hypothetical protein